MNLPFADGLEIGLVFLAVGLLAFPIGHYLAAVFSGDLAGQEAIERRVFGWLGLRANEEGSWKAYAGDVLVFGTCAVVFTFLALLFQAHMPFWTDGKSDLDWDLALNIAISFVTNTNWQAVGGEAFLSRFSQTIVLTLQNFASAATGLAVLIALIRGLARKESPTIGCFWVDLVRGVVFVFVPAAVLVALFLTAQGTVQSLDATLVVPWLDPAQATATPEQVIPLGLVASQTSIALLGTNGGGFYNANMAHPLANPTPLTNLVGMIALVLIPAASCLTFGRLVHDKKQGVVLLIVMTVLFLPFLTLALEQEQSGAAFLATQGLSPQNLTAMEGKEVRFGAAGSALWTALTTAASNGSTNASIASMTPLGSGAALALIQLGEVAFGGVGSGLYLLLTYVLLAVFVAGLMVGRTPEYLGKKIGVFDMKMASLIVILPPMLTLLGTAAAVLIDATPTGDAMSAPFAFTQILYAFTSAAQNNGSAMASLNANTPFYNVALGLAMLVGRYGLIVPVLAIAGSMAAKKKVPRSAGTLSTVDPLFVAFLIAVVVLVGVLVFVPTLALGPVVEHLLRPSSMVP
jgi:K+-transporting ATPase ATPase A chain